MLTAGQLLSFIDLVGIGDAHLSETRQVALFGHVSPLGGLSNRRVIHQLALEVTTKSAHGSGGDHTFRGSTDAHQAVGSGTSETAGDGGLNVSIGDGLDASAGEDLDVFSG